MRLYLVRHADALAPGQPSDDHERPLAAHGERQAGALGAALAARGARPELALCSSARRALQTLAALSAHLPEPPEVRVERALYLADADALLAAIRGVEDGVAELLLVAHNPGVGALAAALAGSGDAAALERLRRGYPPAALAALAFGARGWRRVREAGGELVAFRAPGDAD